MVNSLRIIILSEKQQFTHAGKSMVDKIKPSPDGLGDNKAIGRDCNYMLGLFSPNRYNIQTYGNYDLTRLKDTHRDLPVHLLTEPIC